MATEKDCGLALEHAIYQALLLLRIQPIMKVTMVDGLLQR